MVKPKRTKAKQLEERTMKLMDGFYNCFSTLHFAKLLLAQHNCLDSRNSDHCDHYVLRKDKEDHLSQSSLQRLCVGIAKLHSAEKIAGTQNIDQLGHDEASQEHGRYDEGSALVHVERSSLCPVEFAYRSIILQVFTLREQVHRFQGQHSTCTNWQRSCSR